MTITAEPTRVASEWELISVVLEVAAFFLVTVDLYGEERLRHLQTRSLQVFTIFRLSLFRPMFYGGQELLGAVYHAVIFAAGYGVWHIIHVPSSNRLLVLLWLAAVVVAGALMGLGALLLLIDFLYLLAAIALFLLSKSTVRGLLLAIGAVIFVISKTIIILKLVREIFP